MKPIYTHFIPAKFYGPGRQGAKPQFIGLHCTESPSGSGEAVNVARYFQSIDREASSHYVVDGGSIIKCVRLEDRAWGIPNFNSHSIHVEICGWSNYTREQWLSQPGALLHHAAALIAQLCDAYEIDKGYVTDAELKAYHEHGGELTGIVSHVQVTRVINGGNGHTDPGPAFPYQVLLDLIHSHQTVIDTEL